jgi:hypothetical protein
MKDQLVRPGIAGLCALSLFSAACGGSDADSSADTDPAPDSVPADSVPAETAPVVTETAAPSADGVVFTPPNGDYTITFPGEPTSTPLPVALPTGQVTADAFIYEDGNDAAYFTSVFEYAEGTTDGDPEVVLAGARDGAVSNVGGTLVDSEFVEVDGVPGVSFSFTVTGGEGNALVYYDEPRLYQSFALGEVGQSASFTTFLDTFMFTTTSTEAGDS